LIHRASHRRELDYHRSFMRWALFQQVMQRLVGVRELDPQRDAAPYAERLLSLHPELFANIDGGAHSVRARMAARTIAVDHLREIKRLPESVDELERSLASATMSPGSRLVRVTALAYVLTSHESHADRLPPGYALLDDCIAMCGAKLATPGRLAPGSFGRLLLTELLRIRYLGLALPREMLSRTEAALTYSAQLAARARGLPHHVLERAVLQVVQQPPTTFPATLALPEPESPIEIETVLHLVPAEIAELDGDEMVFAFADGTALRRDAQGGLREA
jgi:hypothetical protein